MYYVYLLSYDDIPIYVGLTDNPCRRYKEHYFDSSSSVFDRARYCAYYKNKFLEMRFVFCSDNYNEAARMEFKSARALFMAGFEIHNKTFYPMRKPSDEIRWPRVNRFPHKLFSASLYNHILENVKKIENEYQGNRLQHLDNSAVSS